MEGAVAQIAMEWTWSAWLKRVFIKRQVDIGRTLALREAEKKVDKIHMALDDRRRYNSFL